MNKNYNKDSIVSLSFKDAVRQKIAMYLGSADMKGVYHAIQEIISNSIDEYIMGYGKEINIILYKDGSISITDYGRGVPFGKKDDGTDALEIVYSKAHTGGKFDDKAYARVVGLNGIGAKATCLSSEFFKVGSRRDGQNARAVFEKGVLISNEILKDNSGLTGTSIHFYPDSEVFNLEPIKIEFDYLVKLCKNLSFLTKGLTFKLYNEETNKTEQLCSKNGIVDLVAEKAESPIHPKPICFTLEDEKNKIEIVVQWTKGREQFYCFTNGAENPEGGTPITGLKTSITRNLNKYFKGQLTGELARTGLIYAVNCSVSNPSFANQTKNKINNPELRSLADKAFSEGFSQFANLNPDALKKIEDFLIREKKAEEAASKARQKIYNATKEIENAPKKVMVFSKLSDSKYHDERSEIYICEGDSAQGAIDGARDADFVASIPIRGKIISSLKNPLEDVLDNEEVQAIFKALGCGWLDKCKPEKLRYGKIIFAADADPDGYSIACLLLALFYKIAPRLIEEGRVYWLQMPAYEVLYKGKTYFAYDEKELSKLPKGEVSKNKGLGQMSEDQFAEAAFGENRRLIQFSIDNPLQAEIMMTTLMGKDTEGRSEYIFKNIDFNKVEE